MKFSIKLMALLLISGCSPSTEIIHSVGDFDFPLGEEASFDVFGRVVVGRRNQLVYFRTGSLPSPIVQTDEGAKNINLVRSNAFSEHSGRAAGLLVLARSRNIISRSGQNERYLDFSLSAMDRRRTLRTALAQFPSTDDFSNDGYVGAIFLERDRSIDGGWITYLRGSKEAGVLDDIMTKRRGRRFSYPLVLQGDVIIEHASLKKVSRETRVH